MLWCDYMEYKPTRSADVVPFPKEKVTPLQRATILIKTLDDAAKHFNGTKPSISRQLEMIRDNLTQARIDVANPHEQQQVRQTLNNRFFGALMGKSPASSQNSLPEVEPALLKELAVRIAAAERALTDCGYFETGNVVNFPEKAKPDLNGGVFSAP